MGDWRYIHYGGRARGYLGSDTSINKATSTASYLILLDHSGPPASLPLG